MGHVHSFWPTPEMVKAVQAMFIHPGIATLCNEKILKAYMGKEKRTNEIIVQGYRERGEEE